MLFSRFTSYFIGFVSVGLLATAAALPGAENDEKKRQTDSVTTVLNTLETQVNTILPQISALNPDSLSSTTAVAPLVAELTTAFSSATSSLTALNSGGILGLKKRADDPTAVATQLASISTNIANTFGPFKKNKHFIIFGGLLTDVDFALKGVLVEVSFLVSGVLVTLSGLLVDVAATLTGLGFTLTVTLLGLL